MDDYVRKVVLVGNGSVGKSSLISRFVEDGFAKVYKQTVGLDLFEKTLTLRSDLRVRLQIWDVGGQSVRSKMISKYLFGAHVVVLTYDLTDGKSFGDLEDWVRVVEKKGGAAGGDLGIDTRRKIFLLGNKVDLFQMRQVSTEQHDAFIKEHRLDGGFLVSARDGDNVLRSFYKIAGLSCGVKLSEYELAYVDQVLTASVTRDNRVEEDEAKNEYLRQIEEEDRLAEQRKLKRHRKNSCNIC